MTATSYDKNYYGSHTHKLFLNHDSNNENNGLNSQELERLRSLELDWINGIEDQIEFANLHVLTEHQIRLQISTTRRSDI